MKFNLHTFRMFGLPAGEWESFGNFRHILSFQLELSFFLYEMEQKQQKIYLKHDKAKKKKFCKSRKVMSLVKLSCQLLGELIQLCNKKTKLILD